MEMIDAAFGMDAEPEANVGDDCAAKLHIESEAEMQRLASASSTPKKKAVFQPKLTKPVKR